SSQHFQPDFYKWITPDGQVAVSVIDSSIYIPRRKLNAPCFENYNNQRPTHKSDIHL
ncbi:24391_t:CDS:2, partial [Dentiscutata erythropus]